MGYSGAGGKLIHKKNQKQKISWHCPFKGPFDGNNITLGLQVLGRDINSKLTDKEGIILT